MFGRLSKCYYSLISNRIVPPLLLGKKISEFPHLDWNDIPFLKTTITYLAKQQKEEEVEFLLHQLKRANCFTLKLTAVDVGFHAYRLLGKLDKAIDWYFVFAPLSDDETKKVLIQGMLSSVQDSREWTYKALEIAKSEGLLNHDVVAYFLGSFLESEMTDEESMLAASYYESLEMNLSAVGFLRLLGSFIRSDRMDNAQKLALQYKDKNYHIPNSLIFLAMKKSVPIDHKVVYFWFKYLTVPDYRTLVTVVNICFEHDCSIVADMVFQDYVGTDYSDGLRLVISNFYQSHFNEEMVALYNGNDMEALKKNIESRWKERQ